MNSEIICVGNEILSGFVTDTNSGYISKSLSKIGIDTKYISVVADDPEGIISALDIARYRAELIVMTGGLGPTSDDITMETVAQYFSKELEVNESIMDKIERRSKDRRDVGDNAYKMALVPQGSVVLENGVGVAPGIVIEDEDIILVVLPGVPKEVRSIMDNEVIPYLKNKVPKMYIEERVIKTHGIAESILFEKLGNLSAKYSEISFLPKNTGVDLKIRIKGEDPRELKDRINSISNSIEQKLREWIYSYTGEEIEEVVGKILSDNGWTLATVESCTGGLLADFITNIPGSSKYFNRGIVTYSNVSKIQEVDVDPRALERFGAVSEEVSKEMAEGALKKFEVDFAVSTTGIAGPSGGSEEKPVGLVYISVASKHKTLTKKFLFNGDRLQNKLNFTIQALIQLYEFLKDLPEQR